MRAKLTYIVVLFIAVCTTNKSFGASPSISFSENCLKAQKHIFSYKLTLADQLLSSEATTSPSNVVVDYLTVARYMLTYVTLEDDAAYDSFTAYKNLAIERISDCSEEDGYRDFLLEEIYFYSSVVNGKKGYALSAANDVRRAYNYGNKVLKDFPEFKAAQKTIGLLNSGFGSLPNTYQKLVSILGYETSMDGGIQLLEDFINAKTDRLEWTLMQDEAAFYLATIYLYLKNDKETAWSMIEGLTQDAQTNPLSTFAKVHFADKCKKNETIITTVNDLVSSADYAQIPFLSFMLGKAKLQRLDADADVAFLKFIELQKGESYVKSAYQKLAWHALVFKTSEDYTHYIELAKEEGNTRLEEDEQAEKSVNTPHIDLLKTRLLFDGGYYAKALTIIRPLKAAQFANTTLSTEYLYRKARVYDALDNSKLAEAFYKSAMEEGESLPNYYASYAALYQAELYERNKDLIQAEVFFKKSMSFSSNREYRKSIEHRAKNGLERIKQVP